MESPIDINKYLSGIQNIGKIANDVLFEKYIIQNKTGYDKIEYLEDTDQESLIVKLNGGYPIIGNIYTFIYKPTAKEINEIRDGKKVEKYKDHVPMVFCVAVKGDSFSGINLNVLPPQERLKFLEMYYNSFKEFFKDLELKTQNNVLAINKKFLTLVLGNKNNNLIKMWSDKAGAAFSFGFRNYNIEQIDRLRSIEFNEWHFIPFFKSDNAVKLMNINNVHKAYWKTL